MAIAIGETLVDVKTGEARYRLVELLARGERYDVAIGEDTHLDGKRVCIKAIRYADLGDPSAIEARRANLYAELGVLTRPSTLLPEPLDWLTVDNARELGERHPLARSEPLLVYEHQPGDTLATLVAEAGGGGIDVERALRMTHELALFLHGLHEAKLIFRRLAPEHLIVGLDDVMHVVGCGNVVPVGSLPAAFRRSLSDPFVAPEARDLDRASLVAPAADVYSLGALLAFLVTGRRPLALPEAPLDAEAHAALSSGPAGLARLVARLMHPNPRKRIAELRAVLPLLESHQVPDPDHRELVGAELMPPPAAPPRKGLSAGPLVVHETAPSTAAPPESAQAGDAPPARQPSTPLSPREHRLVVTAAVVGAVGLVSLIVVLLLLLL